jgi:cystathionine gamma-synthase
LVKGDAKILKLMIAQLKIFIATASLGGFESLVEQRLTVEEPISMVPKNLIRISIGIEDVEVLIVDLQQAVDQV